jgi:hypothetical protein
LASKGLSFGKKKDEDCGEESGGHRSFDLQEIEKSWLLAGAAHQVGRRGVSPDIKAVS